MFPVFSGCSRLKTRVYPVEQLKHSVLPGNTYVILGQEIRDGNIRRVSHALYINGHMAISKGVVTPKVYYMDLKTEDQIDFLVTDRSNHAYRIWEIDPKEIKPEGRALVFCQMFGNDQFTRMPRSDTGIGKKTAWMTPVEYGKETFFYGIAFTLTRPGIYYLGEAAIGGSLFEQTDTGKKFISIGDFRRGVYASPEKAVSYLKTLRIDTSIFFDLSGQWKKLSWDDLIPYKNADPNVLYAIP